MVEDLKGLLEIGDIAKIKQIMEAENLEIRDGKLIAKNIQDCEEKADYWDKQQHVRKIGLNSVYGAVTNEGSMFVDVRMGQSCTLTGRCTTRHMGSTINETIIGTYELGEMIVYGDTDSIYFTIPENIKKTINRDEFIELSNTVASIANESFADFYKNTFNVSKVESKVIKCEREICADTTYFLKKKRYAALVYDEKNRRLDTGNKAGKLKVMGLEIKRSDCPAWVQHKLEDTLYNVLAYKPEFSEIVSEIRSWRHDFLQQDKWKMGIPKRVNKLTHYTDCVERQVQGITIPGHVRAAINWNKMVKNNNDKVSPLILDGGKVIVCKLLPNVFKIDSIAYPVDMEYLPEWFTTLPFDVDAMINVAIDSKVKNIFGQLGIDLQSTKINPNHVDLYSEI